MTEHTLLDHIKFANEMAKELSSFNETVELALRDAPDSLISLVFGSYEREDLEAAISHVQETAIECVRIAILDASAAISAESAKAIQETMEKKAAEQEQSEEGQ